MTGTVRAVRKTVRAAPPVECAAPPVAAPRSAEAAADMSARIRERIQARAFDVYLQRQANRILGDELSDWTQAEEEFRRELQRASSGALTLMIASRDEP